MTPEWWLLCVFLFVLVGWRAVHWYEWSKLPKPGLVQEGMILVSPWGRVVKVVSPVKSRIDGRTLYWNAVSDTTDLYSSVPADGYGWRLL